MSNIERLQKWLVKHCDGNWEHLNGIKIATTDNPGWLVTMDVDTLILPTPRSKGIIGRVEWDYTDGVLMAYGTGATSLNSTLDVVVKLLRA